MNFGKYMFAGC